VFWFGGENIKSGVERILALNTMGNFARFTVTNHAEIGATKLQANTTRLIRTLFDSLPNDFNVHTRGNGENWASGSIKLEPLVIPSGSRSVGKETRVACSDLLTISDVSDASALDGNARNSTFVSRIVFTITLEGRSSVSF
jgi:hypothetical protein